MNKKYMVYSVLMMSLLAYQPSFAMGGKMFKLARFVGVTTLPALGFWQARKIDKERQKPLVVYSLADYFSPEETMVLNKWFMEKKHHVGIANPETIFLGLGPEWVAAAAKTSAVVGATQDNLLSLGEALVEKPELEKRRFELLRASNHYKQDVFFDGNYNKYTEKDAEKIKETIGRIDHTLNHYNENIELYNKKIAKQTASLKHELGHIVHKDSERIPYVVATIPLGIEAVSFGVTKALRKVCNIARQPKMFLKTVLRSCSSVGAVVPKFLMGSVAFSLYTKHQEVEADRFACENAESRLELQEWKNEFDDYFNKNLKIVAKIQALRQEIITANGDISQLPDVTLSPLLLSPYNVPQVITDKYDFYGKKVLKKIYKELNNSHISERKEALLQQIAHEIVQPTHPTDIYRAKEIEKYIARWDREYPGDKTRT